jgi:hypothetical protein
MLNELLPDKRVFIHQSFGYFIGIINRDAQNCKNSGNRAFAASYSACNANFDQSNLFGFNELVHLSLTSSQLDQG